MRPFNPLTRRAVIAGALALATEPLPAQSDGFRVIRAQPAGYDGKTPGPVLRIRRGDEIRVRLINELATETAIHWHGVRVPNAMDGTSLVQRPVAPGASFDYRFAPPDAGTFWFHPPLRTPADRALHGVLIVEEAKPVEVDRDVALVVDAPDAKFTTNGLSEMDIPVAANHRLRLRLVNVAERFITLRIDGHPMNVVAIDGQPAEPFLSRDSRITLSPGNRADVFVDAVGKPGSVSSIMVQNDGVDVPLARMVYADGAPVRPSPRSDIRPLPGNALPERMDFRGALRAELSLEAAAQELPALPLFSAKRRRTIMLALVNKSPAPVVSHIHGHHVRLLDALDDGWKPFWLDTILCAPQQTTRIAFVADNPGKWLLQTRAIGGQSPSLAWFEVT
jgi:FtsP/CotA-like multicopper oxidase with cupredoxin domain